MHPSTLHMSFPNNQIIIHYFTKLIKSIKLLELWAELEKPDEKIHRVFQKGSPIVFLFSF